MTCGGNDHDAETGIPEKVEDAIFRRMLNIENICMDQKISDKDFRYRVRVEIRDLLADISKLEGESK